MSMPFEHDVYIFWTGSRYDPGTTDVCRGAANPAIREIRGDIGRPARYTLFIVAQTPLVSTETELE